MAKRSISLEVARLKADALLHHLSPVCERIEVAGSIRRGKTHVGDIELVAVPRMFEHVSAQADLFGEAKKEPPKDRIDEAIAEANRLESGRPYCTDLDPCRACLMDQECGPRPWLSKLNNGHRYIKLRDNYLGLQIDLFLVRPPAEWGPIFALRTGPAKFSQRLVTGLHVRKLRCRDGRVVDSSGRHMPCPDEQRFFRLCGFRWKEPEERR